MITTCRLAVGSEVRTQVGREISALVLITLTVAGVYLAFLSRHYSGDGIRWLSMIEAKEAPAAPLKNVLFPVLAWLFYHTARALGFAGESIRVVQSMNALAGAMGVGLFCWLLRRYIRDVRAMLLGGVLLGFSHAYTLHATDMTEPMPSFPVAMGAFLVAATAGSRNNRGIAACAGALLGLSASIYLSAVLSLPALLFLMGLTAPDDLRIEWRRTFRLAIPAILALAGVMAGTFLLGAWLRGETTLATLFTQFEGTGREIGFATSLKAIHFLALLFGWANAIVVLWDWYGFRPLLGVDNLPNTIQNLTALALVSWLTVVIVRWRLQRRETMATWGSGFLVVCLLWFFVPVLLPLAWGPTYEKLWIHPTAGFIATLAWLAAQDVSPISALEPRPGWPLAALGIAALLVVGSSSAFDLVPRQRPSDEVAYAHRLAQRVGPEDLVVGEGWDPVSVYFSTFSGKRFFSYVDTAFRLKRTPERLRDRLAQAIEEARRQGGRVYFIGLLDVPLQEWERYYGPAHHLRYEELDRYRLHRRLVEPIGLKSYTRRGEMRGIWEYLGPPHDPGNAQASGDGRQMAESR